MVTLPLPSVSLHPSSWGLWKGNLERAGILLYSQPQSSHPALWKEAKQKAPNIACSSGVSFVPNGDPTSSNKLPTWDSASVCMLGFSHALILSPLDLSIISLMFLIN